MSRLEPKKKNHAAKVQQRNVSSFQPAPPGPVLARARAIGARRMDKDPKIRRLSKSRLSIYERSGNFAIFAAIRRASLLLGVRI
jgi:hypothetical protein